MFEASKPVLLFDYFRVPYEASASASSWPAELAPEHPLRTCCEVRVPGDDASPQFVCWPVFSNATRSRDGLRPSEGRLESIPIYGRLASDELTGGWLADTRLDWSPAVPVQGASGSRIASVWRASNGSLFLPFDPAEVITNYWSEGYVGLVAGDLSVAVKRQARRLYYLARPLMPRIAQLGLRRLLIPIQARNRFPRWPIEPALHDLFELLFRYLARLARAPVPFVSPWPNGYSWAQVLTHDVETAFGYERLHLLRDVEAARGYRSSWYFVPMRYSVDEASLRALTQDGFEIGVHGLRHDGRDLASLAHLSKRLPAIRAYADRWRAAGFRSPATQRAWELMPLLGFEYDSSYPDTDPFEPQAGGCCSWLPYFNGDLVELPITLPQDHTLFAILRKRDETTWLEKTSYLKRRGGMALMLTHPDYMVEPSRLEAYARYLEAFAADSEAWRALPKEVADWWRRRAASHLILRGGKWEVIGPAAADGRVAFFSGT